MFSTEKQGAVEVISGSVPIAGDHVEEVAQQFDACLGSGQPMVVLDLSRVAFFDSVGLELLLEYSEHFALLGGDLRLAGANPLCVDILKATGLYTRFDVFTGHKEAVGSFSR